jgi:1-phosphatidylinositol-3-phosphate 5-kinase
MTIHVRNATIARVFSRRGAENITVVSVVSSEQAHLSMANALLGLIYCSRCASNIVKGSRFGQEGQVRVCNLCLDQITKVDQDEDDDRGSVASSAMTSSFPHDTVGYGPSRRYQPGSPFTSNQLFGRNEDPFGLFSIAEARRTMHYGSEDSAFDSRATTPDAEIGPDALGVPVRAAPFRRAVFPEDDKVSDVTVIEPDQPPPRDTSKRARSPVEFPQTIAVPQDGLSSIQFPGSSPDPAMVDGPFSTGLTRSRYSSFADIDSVPTPFIRSRVQSRLMDNMATAEAGWRTRRESIALVISCAASSPTFADVQSDMPKSSTSSL